MSMNWQTGLQVFQKVTNNICHDISNAILNVSYPFQFHADSLNVGTGCILIQDFLEGKKLFQPILESFSRMGRTTFS